MTEAKAINNSLRLVNIYNTMRTMLDRTQTLDNVKPAEFSELIDIRSKVHDAIFMSLEDVNNAQDRIDILNKL